MIELLEKKIILDEQTSIREYITKNGNVRALCVNGCVQSLIYIDEEKRCQLFNDYLNFFNLPIEINNNFNNYLMLGGGMFVYPQHFARKYPNKRITVIEKEKKYIDIAEKYFYLNEANYRNLKIVIADALSFAFNNNDIYDCVCIDLFNGKTPIEEAYSVFYISKLKNILTSNGIIIANYIISKENINYYKSLFNRISKMFIYFKIISTDESFNLENTLGNVLIIMTDIPFKIPDMYNYLDLTKKLTN